MPIIAIGTGVNHLTRLLSALPLPNTITITNEPDAGTLTTATAGQTHAELLALIDEGAATTDGPGSVTITATLLGDSTDPVQSGQSITGVYLLYTATEAPSVPRNIVFDPAITVPVPVPAPVITGLPTISGVERVGELLTATPASVTNGGTLTWQWFAGGVAIEGAESITFSLTLAQEGTAITVRQTQTNDTGSATATSNATGAIVHVAPTASNALADQSFTIGTGVQTYAAAGDFTGEELTFSLNTVTGVTVNAATGVVSFDTDTMALQASTSIVVTASNSGGSVQSGFGVSITAVAFAFTDNADGTLDVTTEGTAPTPIVVNNGDGTATTDEAGAYIYKPSANAVDDFTGAVGSSTLATATGAGTFKVYKRIATAVTVATAKAYAEFGFFSDTHANQSLATYNGRYPQDAVLKMDDAVTAFNARDLDFVLSNGDYIDHNDGATVSAALGDLAWIEASYDNVTAPRYYSFGNHDLDVLTKAQFIANSGMTENYYSVVVRGVTVIVLDSCYRSDDDADDYAAGNFTGQNPFIPPNQRTWLTNTLAAAPGDCIVFVHFRLDEIGAAPHLITNRAAVRTILETAGNVTHVFQSHSHAFAQSTIGGIIYTAMEALTDDPHPAAAFSFMRIYDSGPISLEFVGDSGASGNFYRETITPTYTSTETLTLDAETLELDGETLQLGAV